MESFESWARQQIMVKGHSVVSVKNAEGINVKWVNTTTGEEFITDFEGAKNESTSGD